MQAKMMSSLYEPYQQQSKKFLDNYVDQLFLPIRLQLIDETQTSNDE